MCKSRAGAPSHNHLASLLRPCTFTDTYTPLASGHTLLPNVTPHPSPSSITILHHSTTPPLSTPINSELASARTIPLEMARAFGEMCPCQCTRQQRRWRRRRVASLPPTDVRIMACMPCPGGSRRTNRLTASATFNSSSG